MNYSLILIAVGALIVFELLHEISNLFFKILILISKILIVLLEYFTLYKIWSANGLFTQIMIPVIFLGFVVIQIMLYQKCKEKSRLRKALISSTVILTPVLSVVSTYFMAQLFNIKIKIIFDMMEFMPPFLKK